MTKFEIIFNVLVIAILGIIAFQLSDFERNFEEKIEKEVTYLIEYIEGLEFEVIE